MEGDHPACSAAKVGDTCRPRLRPVLDGLGQGPAVSLFIADLLRFFEWAIPEHVGDGNLDWPADFAAAVFIVADGPFTFQVQGLGHFRDGKTKGLARGFELGGGHAGPHRPAREACLPQIMQVLTQV